MYKERLIYSALEKQKDNNKITILTGARQVGKTTLMRKLYETFQKTHDVMFLDLDIYSMYEKVSTYENCINTLKLNGYKTSQKKPYILFLDEFQRYADISRVLKNIYDHHSNIKIYASGSSSLAINEQVQESLAGRKRIIHIYPLSFSEYLNFIEKDDLIQQIDRLPEIRSDNLTDLMPEVFQALEKFLIYGGYPEVVLSSDKEKADVLVSIFDLYVKKDLVDFLRVERIKHAKTLIRHIAVNNGKEAKYSEMAQVAGIDEKTVKNYIEILKETFLISVHSPWFTNRNKELVKMPKVYFSDNGVRNYFINNFNSVALRSDMPFLFEGFVISELIKKGVSADHIKFWRTKNKDEVDLIIDNGSEIRPIEIKFKKNLKSSDFKGLYKFNKTYPDHKPLFMVNLCSNTPVNDIIFQLSPFEINGLLDS
jgi:predicted AAA+ superfamily ATPase